MSVEAFPQQNEIDNGGQTELQALESLLCVSPVIEAVARPQLWKCYVDALQVTADPREQEILRITTGICDWKLFGKLGDALPEGLVWAVAEDGSKTLEQDSRLACWIADPIDDTQDAEESLKRHGFGDVASAVDSDLKSRKSEIYTTLQSLLETSPEYSVIEAFEALMAPQVSERPLSPFMKQILEAQSEDKVRTQFGIPDYEKITFRDLAGSALARTIYAIDEQTMPHKVDAPESDAVERARKFFTPFMKDSFAKCEPDKTFKGIGYSEDTGAVIFTDTEDDYRYLVTIYPAAAKLFSNALGQQKKTQAASLGEDFAEHFLHDLYEHRTEKNFKDRLDSTLQNWLNDKFKNYIAGFYDASMENDLKHETIRVRICEPIGEHVPISVLDEAREDLSAWPNLGNFSNEIGFNDKETIREQEENIIGAAINTPWYMQSNSRLVQFQPTPEEVPDTLTFGAFTISIPQIRPGLAPHIPGMKLVSSRGHMFDFFPDENGDPYAKCDVPIPQDKINELTRIYDELGLSDLASALEEDEQVTVERLVSLIKKNSVYHIPSEHDDDDTPFEGDMDITSFDDFKPLIEDGELFAQCTISDEFLQLSLGAIFGEELVGRTRGYVFNPNDPFINGVGHVQTTLTYEGRIYLLDATPSREEYISIDDQSNPPPQPLHASAPPAPSSKNVTRPITTNQNTIAIPEQYSPEEQREITQDSLLKSAEQQLRIFFSAHDRAALYDKLATLGSSDPIRRTIETLIATRKQAASHDNLQAAVNYLALYSDAKPEELTKFNLPRYDTIIIESMIDTLLQMQETLPTSQAA